jgi:hypothetical protein
MSKHVKKQNKKVGARAFYRQVNWAEWWDEFCFEITKNGSPKYKTVWAFAKVKGKNNQEASVIYQAIGPEPQNKKQLVVPWQGDWGLRREKGFWHDPDGSKFEILQAAIKQKADSLDTLKLLSVVPARLVDLYKNVLNKILAHYGGQPCLDSLDEEENYARATNLLRLIDRCRQGVSGSIDDLAKTLGLHPDAPESWTELAVISAEQGAKAALRGQEEGLKQGIGVGASYARTLTDMVHMCLQKQQAFDLPMPAELDEGTPKGTHAGQNGNSRG